MVIVLFFFFFIIWMNWIIGAAWIFNWNYFLIICLLWLDILWCLPFFLNCFILLKATCIFLNWLWRLDLALLLLRLIFLIVSFLMINYFMILIFLIVALIILVLWIWKTNLFFFVCVSWFIEIHIIKLLDRAILRILVYLLIWYWILVLVIFWIYTIRTQVIIISS